MLSVLADDLQPIGVADDFFAGGVGTSSGAFGGFDGAPVGEAGRLDAALGQQGIEPLAAALSSIAVRGQRRRDLLGDLIAVGPVGADLARGSTPLPADRVE